MTTAEPKRCLGCGYILEGLPENRCPECGREFDPGDPTTYVGRAESGWPYLIVAVGSILAMVAFPYLAFRWSAPRGWVERLGEAVIASAAVIGFVLELVVLFKGVGALTRPRELIRQRWAVAVAVALAVSFFGLLAWSVWHR